MVIIIINENRVHPTGRYISYVHYKHVPVPTTISVCEKKIQCTVFVYCTYAVYNLLQLL